MADDKQLDTSIEKKALTYSALIERGWTKKLVLEFLPAPGLKQNPFYRSGPPMKLWLASDIERIEASEAFKAAKEKHAKRKWSAQKGVQTKIDKLLREIETSISEISVRQIPDEQLRIQAYNEKSMWYEQKNSGHCLTSLNFIPEDTMSRWVVNYIRHNFTNYDRTLYDMSGKVGALIAYSKYKNAVLQKIAEAYPKYKKECFRQMVDLENRLPALSSQIQSAETRAVSQQPTRDQPVKDPEH